MAVFQDCHSSILAADPTDNSIKYTKKMQELAEWTWGYRLDDTKSAEAEWESFLYALCLESFCARYSADWKVLNFCVSEMPLCGEQSEQCVRAVSAV